MTQHLCYYRAWKNFLFTTDEEDECRYRCRSSATCAAAAERALTGSEANCAIMTLQCMMHSQVVHKPACPGSLPSLLAWSQRVRQASTSSLLRKQGVATAREHRRIRPSCAACGSMTISAVATGAQPCQIHCRNFGVCCVRKYDSHDSAKVASRRRRTADTAANQANRGSRQAAWVQIAIQPHPAPCCAIGGHNRSTELAGTVHTCTAG